MGRLRRIVRRASRTVKKIGQLALPLVFPAIGTGGGLPPFLGERGEEEPTEEEGGPPLPPEGEEEGEEVEEDF